ncbi:aspartyl/asparaginyl beta-hydroxylase-like isoform X2 [Centruroides sculpturatus]|uniref:aspartyl/asparaginyl beta-hydroxylase-like isoform X2 n=1 Tax=Centruroides sculpturatus TaxID=218467 RepID=UPI000C6D8B30|nr:aspartyl/asparaginyl beta-hydroxylase-like isoform X2 [Centruroides sculpturatus]
MSEREPRKRKKRREGQKKDLNAEDVFFPTKKQEEWQKDSEPEQEEETVPHEPSVIAKVIFFLIFSLLIVATGAVFIALRNADRSIGIISDSDTSHSELHTEELPISFIEDLKAEEVKEGSEAELWIEETLPNLEILQEEEMPSYQDSQPPTDAFAEIIHEEKEPEEPEVSPQIEISEKESIDFSFEDSDQIYFETTEESSLPIVEETLDIDRVDSFEDAEETEEIFTHVPTEHYEESTESEPFFVETEDKDTEPITVSKEDTTESLSSPVEEAVTEESTEQYQSEIPTEYEVYEFPSSAEPLHEKADIPNENDFQFGDDIDKIERIVDKEPEEDDIYFCQTSTFPFVSCKSPEEAMHLFEEAVKKFPDNPYARYGKAMSLDKMAEERRSNALLEQSINEYVGILNMPNVSDKVFVAAGSKGTDRMRFRGFIGKAIQVQMTLADRFPENADIMNQLAVNYLLIGKGQNAKKVLKEVLQRHPDNGFAKVHYGFILKTEDNDYPAAIKYLSEGIATRESGVIDGRFFFHLGDALNRIGKPKEAMNVYEQGVKDGLFLSVYQRSLYNVNGLTGKPWWDPKETPYYSSILTLQEKWEVIRNEALALMNTAQSGFLPESEGLRDTGDWKQFELFARGHKTKNCERAPVTCSLIGNIPDAAGCRRGQAKFSVLQPGTHIWAHTGPTNCRIRGHLGLVVPKGVKIRVANDTREWKEGKMIIFDDSFEHEVWHKGNKIRLVLIVDFWHPELSARHKATLSAI